MQASHKKKCLDVLHLMKGSKYRDKVFYFLTPVRETLDPEEWITYTSIIEQPRDLATIEDTLKNDGYGSLSAFCKDVDLCFENAKKYNKTRYKQVADAAIAMHKVRPFTLASCKLKISDTLLY